MKPTLETSDTKVKGLPWLLQVLVEPSMTIERRDER